MEGEKAARDRCISNGADPDTVIIVRSDVSVVEYVEAKARIQVMAAGEWLHKVTTTSGKKENDDSRSYISPKTSQGDLPQTTDIYRVPKGIEMDPDDPLSWDADFIARYKPKIHQGIWHLDIPDLYFISLGTCILGCGASGDDESSFLAAREMLRQGMKIKVIDIDSLGEEASVGWGGYIGCLEPVMERLAGNE